ncbi:MAG: aminoacyl-tRNA hydrolase [Planctomycetota bacterium]
MWRFLRLVLRAYFPPDPVPSAADIQGESVKLVVGLGNLEKQYEGTRHNIGFEVVDKLARDLQGEWSGSKLSAMTCAVRPKDGDRLILAKPTTLMNRSGFAVTQLLEYYKVEVADLLVICDDFNIGSGMLRLRGKGSHGGQNGLRHIIEQLGTEEYARLRLGIGPVPPHPNPARIVLNKFKPAERPEIDDMVERAMFCVFTWNTDGVDAAQQRWNGDGKTSSD